MSFHINFSVLVCNRITFWSELSNVDISAAKICSSIYPVKFSSHGSPKKDLKLSTLDIAGGIYPLKSCYFIQHCLLVSLKRFVVMGTQVVNFSGCCLVIMLTHFNGERLESLL
jgi:hypothetical protein